MNVDAAKSSFSLLSSICSVDGSNNCTIWLNCTCGGRSTIDSDKYIMNTAGAIYDHILTVTIFIPTYDEKFIEKNLIIYCVRRTLFMKY